MTFRPDFYIGCPLCSQVRSDAKRVKAGKYVTKVKAKQRRKQHLAANQLEADEMADLWHD